MAKINQVSPGDPVSNLALEGILTTCPILQDVEFMPKPGSSPYLRDAREGTVLASYFRSLNENNTATPPTPAYSAIPKKIVSFDAKVDVVIEDRNELPEAELALQTRLEAIEAGWALQYKIFFGDDGVNAEEFDGLDTLVHADWDLSLADAAFGSNADGHLIELGSDNSAVLSQQKAIEYLLTFMSMVRGGASHIYMPEALKIRLLTVAKNLGYYRQSKDELGNSIDIINDTVIRGAGRQKDGTEVLGFSEIVGTSEDCAAIYGVRWGDGIDLYAITSVGVKGRFAGQSGNFITNNINMDMAFHRQNNTALVKLTGWRI